MTGILAREEGVRAYFDGPTARPVRQPVAENPALTCLKRASRVLMLQGPVGPFFDRVTDWLLAQDCHVERVVFQGGDQHDCQAVSPLPFAGLPGEWPAFISQLLNSMQPDCVALFGQSRFYHKVALDRAEALGIPTVVMEEGYFRPGYVTMELGGVNGHSTTLDRFQWLAGAADSLRPAITPMHFQKMAWHASWHYIAMDRNRGRFPHYEHHRSTHVPSYALYWMRSWARKGMYHHGDRALQRWLIETHQPYYFVPLQLEGDSQIRQHSPYASIAQFVTEVLESFAHHAPRDSLLVFRQHPHARGGQGHQALISTLARDLGVSARVRHMVEGDTPELAEHSLGTVLINSTVGLQALERGSPLIVMGDAPYKRPDLTFSGGLDNFWKEHKTAPVAATRRFLAQVKNLTQAPASVYALRGEPLAWLTRGIHISPKVISL
jgi:capsular polysaccharide export protein